MEVNIRSTLFFFSVRALVFFFFLALWRWLFYCPSVCFLSLMCLRPTLHVRFFFFFLSLCSFHHRWSIPPTPTPSDSCRIFHTFLFKRVSPSSFSPLSFFFFFTFWAVLVVAALFIRVCTFKAPLFVLAPT